MAQVPDLRMYPTVQPTTQGLPGVSVNTPAAAFGGATGAATSELAGTLGKVGNELFARAEALQQLNNETAAKDEDIKFMINAGKIHAEYNALEGRARVAAFPKYSEDLQSLYRTHRGNLGNPMAQRMFDSAAVSTLSRSIFNGAGAAASAQSQAAHTSAVAAEALLVKNAGDPTLSNKDFDALLEKNKSNVYMRSQHSPGGWSEEVEAAENAKANSTMARSRIEGIARQNPEEGVKLYDEYVKRGLLQDQDRKMVEREVDTFIKTTGMTQVADTVLTANANKDRRMGFDKSEGEMKQQAVDAAQARYPSKDKAVIKTEAEAAFQRQYSNHLYTMNQERKEVQDQYNGYINKGVSRLDQLPQEFVDRMDEKQKKSFDFDALQAKIKTSAVTSYPIKERLIGMYSSSDPETKLKFQEMNFWQVPGLNTKDIKELNALQHKANANGDPRVSKAMHILEGSSANTLKDLGVHKAGALQDQFKGALHSALVAWQEDRGKPPTDKELSETILPQISKKIVNPGNVFGNWAGWDWMAKDPLFQTDIPTSESDKIKKAIKADTGIEPTEDLVRSKYFQGQFKKLFEKSKPAKTDEQVPGPGPNTPGVPNRVKTISIKRPE